MSAGYTLDCVDHACALAQLLIDDGLRPWIGRLRDRTETPDGIFHAPLIPTRFTGQHLRVWNTHYICCADGNAYDPIIGAPVPLEQYARMVFGRELAIEEHLSADATADLLLRGELRSSFRRTG